ncbi:PROTAMINE P1 FAMILY PROTEIN [Salix koriyanagi]|uniref:PROTAMINE P1 FAMILY PROTEIN n=1 Tax=Salix koriyanagi TaxID=2511006 RepID=A0A9Q0ZTS2_9ROSI|nr:PROTAMINE P1 FAMILY PROTEIN [Salix koriyanagi]
MKLSAKPISSPGRTDKYYPPPLMRFLRSNVGSRSRGRSRSSPMFVRKKNTAIETQEPSSPKVTCMGQVRVRRSKQANTRPGKPKKRRCKWIRKTLLCHHHFNRRKLKLKSFRPSWSKWVHFFRVGIERKNKIGEECSSSKVEPKIGVRSDDFEQGREGEEMEPQLVDFGGRLRRAKKQSRNSAVHRKKTEKMEVPYRKESLFLKNPINNQSSDPETEVKISHFKEFEGSIASIRERTANIEESKTEKVSTALPLVLTRCKSEPARTSEKLDPVVILWKKRRLGFT